MSADPPQTNLAWARELQLPFRLLSDVGPDGAVGRRWGVWDELWKLQRRATFIVGADGLVRWTEAGGVCLDTSRALDALGRLAGTR